MSYKRTLGVFCGSRNGSLPSYQTAARLTGKAVADLSMNLIFGGGGRGLMGAVASSALAHGAEVFGVIPEFLTDREPPLSGLSELTVVKTMSERKRLLISRSDLILVLPGGIGTLDETFQVLTGNCLNSWRKPVGFLNTDGYFDRLLAFLEDGIKSGFISPGCPDLIRAGEDPRRLIEELIALQPENAEEGRAASGA